MSHPCTSILLNNRGLTLIELITTLASLTILIALATPSFLTLTLRSEQSSAVEGFLKHFHLARTLAIQREQRQIVCPSKDGETCLNHGRWSQGLIIFEDRDKNGLQDPDEQIQGVYLLPEETKIAIHSNRHNKWVIYHGDGRPSGYNRTLTFCDPEARIKPKALIINNVGRIRISDKAPGDKPLKCD